MPAVPVVPWGSFRHDVGNSGAAGLVNQNNGNVTMLCSVALQSGTTQCPGAITESSPVVDRDGNILLGGDKGLTSFGPDGRFRWTFEGYETSTQTPHHSGCAPCALSMNSPTCLPVGRVAATPSVTPGNTIVFGTEGTVAQPGHLFAIQQANGTFTCDWFYPTGGSGIDFTSSAATQISNFDFTLSSAFVGADDGQLRAFNSDGTVRWSFDNRAEAGPITSTPAIDASNNVYITTTDGVLSAVNFTGGQVWQSPIGIAPSDSTLYPSPGVSTSIYGIGAGGTVFAISPSSQPVVAPKWQFIPPAGSDGTPIPIVGSPAFITQSFPDGSVDTVDTIVYVVDAQGTAFGLRDFNGQPFPVQRCTGGDTPATARTPTTSCRTDSCQPPTTCDVASGRCKLPTPTPGGDAVPADEAWEDTAPRAYASDGYDSGETSGVTVPTPTPLPACTRDTCVADMRGTCEISPAIISIPGASVEITTSPVVSGDFFAIVGTSDGQICARSFDPPYGVVPGYNHSPPNKIWGAGFCNNSGTTPCVVTNDCPTGGLCIPGGCIHLSADPTNDNPTVSSPVIGQNGAIYVTTADGLYAIK